MARGNKYRVYHNGGWKFWVLPEYWSVELRTEVLRRVTASSPAKHPLIQRLALSGPGDGGQLYLKIYGRSGIFGSLKDLGRDSKALRALKQSEMLAQCGFSVPVALAAGEERRWGDLRRAFLLTVAVKGRLLPHYVRDHYSAPGGRGQLHRKREQLRQLAREIRRLHDTGFVHGDLVPYNIMVREEASKISYFFLDNDRTRRYPRWLPQRFWRRNLVQLNRFELPGISLPDRRRFLRAYLGERCIGRQERQLGRWLEKRTRQRWTKFRPVGSAASRLRPAGWHEPLTTNSAK